MSEDFQRRFDEAFKKWAVRPAPTASERATAQVMARLAESRRRPSLAARRLRLAAAAGVVTVAVLGWLTLGPVTQPVAEVPLPALGEDVLLLWLDPQTPLYLTVAPPAAKGGS